LILVTHHVEEVPPNFTDVLLLREGRIVAQGPVEITLTEANLSATFGMPLELERRGDRWTARLRTEEETTGGSARGTPEPRPSS
jgi:iron complex transport system ATP-binding protein